MDNGYKNFYTLTGTRMSVSGVEFSLLKIVCPADKNCLSVS